MLMSDSLAVQTPGVDESRRTWIAITCGVGAIGGVAAAVPFVESFAPSERAKAAGAPVEVDIGGLKPGAPVEFPIPAPKRGGRRTVECRGQPVWIIRRTPEMIASLAKDEAELADPQ